MRLRLLITEKCNRNCPDCCNKQWDLSTLPIEEDFTGYDLIILTGGEPLLIPATLYNVVENIRRLTDTPIVVYTAKIDDIRMVNWVLDIVDGLTVTLHDQDDVVPFMKFAVFMNHYKVKKSLRLNVFEGIELPLFKYQELWQIKRDIVWIDPCPLPTDEIFKQSTPDWNVFRKE